MRQLELGYRNQRAAKTTKEAQRRALKLLRMGPAAGGAAVPQARTHAERSMEIVLAARQHLADVGPLTDASGRIIVADSYRPVIDGRQVKLRKRPYVVRKAFDGYDPERRALFAGLGLPWAEPDPQAAHAAPAET
jgi:hypothetical protein